MIFTGCARKLKTRWLNEMENIDNNCWEGNFIELTETGVEPIRTLFVEERSTI